MTNMKVLAAAMASLGVLADASPAGGGPVDEIRPGDVVWIPPGVKHWHGASPVTAMTHIAVQEYLDGKVVEWMEKVSDEQYGTSPAAVR